MFFDEIVHGTQYYRAPTPLEEEWETDLEKFEKYGIGAFQIRINWRWNEIREGEYNFDDVDRLMDLAEKYNRKVVIKFLLECAPQYVFDKYDGVRIGPKGERIRGGSHGAFYGGWRPCFTNPHVKEAARRFVEQVTLRYKDRPNLMFWNAWNEIRNKPMEDCFCPHCRRAYGEYLKNRFGTIENLNSFYGVAEDSFESIALPSTPQGYWDTFEFKKFKGGENLCDFVRIVTDEVKKHDKVHPVMCHVGITSAFQDNLGDVCDDYKVSRTVDFWGTSIPCATDMTTPSNRMDFMMLLDFMRSVDKNYFLYEIYPGLGMFKYTYDTPYDMSFKLYASLSSAAKGMIYWQYRAERVGHEADCAGLVRADGSERPVIESVAYFGKELEKNKKYLVGAEAQDAEIAIAFDFDSMIISEIDDYCGKDFYFELNNPRYYYRRAHAGMYRMLCEMNYKVDYLNASDSKNYSKYKVLYFPYYAIINGKIHEDLADFVRNGGTVIADEGFGLRCENTWMQPYDIACGDVMKARMRERRRMNDVTVELKGEPCSFSPFKTEYYVNGAEVIAKFEDGTPAIQKVGYGKGFVYLCGVSVGYSSYETRQGGICSFVEDILGNSGVGKNQFSSVCDGVYEKRTESDEYENVFLFNCSGERREFECGEHIALGGYGRLENGKYVLDDGQMGYFVREKKA